MVSTGIYFNLFAQQRQTQQNAPTQQKKSNVLNKAAQPELKWFNPDYRPFIKSFDYLTKYTDAFSKNKLSQALSNYQNGKSIINHMRKDVERFIEESSKARHFNEKWYWQVMQRKAREQRVANRMKRKAKLEAVTHFTRAIHNLDEIESKRIRESKEFKDLIANIYLEWVVYQYDLGNIPQCIEVLNLYMEIDPKYEQEITPHNYLASAYGFRERVLLKYNGGTEQLRLFYKKKKNQHLLRAVELKYKKGSPEYEKMVEVVNRDEVIAVSP